MIREDVYQTNPFFNPKFASILTSRTGIEGSFENAYICSHNNNGRNLVDSFSYDNINILCNEGLSLRMR